MSVREVQVPAFDEDGRLRAYLQIALLPRADESSSPPPLIKASAIEGESEQPLSDVQVLEGHEYLYEWISTSELPDAIRTEPSEVFQADTSDGKRGRFRPALATGVVAVELLQDYRSLATCEVEVRSRKLNYLTEYSWMLRDIAEQMTELMMERFAASSLEFRPVASADAPTLYQRFAFLRALLATESFQNALHEVLRCPHVGWETHTESVLPGKALKASSTVVRQLCASSRRVNWEDGPISSIPIRLESRRTEATRDTTPNRFVRFALERWRHVVNEIHEALKQFPETSPIARGRREVAIVLDRINEVLSHELFREARPLSHFPANNQVLHRREGYREIFRAYLEFELAAQLSWRGNESSYSAGQRDVATLYEYWAFIQLALIVARLLGKSFDLGPLLAVDGSGLSVSLKKGRETILKGEILRYGRFVSVELCFNRTFRGNAAGAGSWTRTMRPDYSLIIQPGLYETASFSPICIHFDAKYRVNFVEELFGQGEDDTQKSTDEATPTASREYTRADLLKMHAYRDAIRRSAGAYILYPGDLESSRSSVFQEYHELLPGLGAFALRPSATGVASGLSVLSKFIDDVLSHVASRLTRHERGRFWIEDAYSRHTFRGTNTESIQDEPSLDTRVLLGYVKSTAHWNWIHETRTYNLRAAGRQGGVPAGASLLYSQLLLLYCPKTNSLALARVVSGPEFVTKEAITSTGYPTPTSDYWCVQFSWLHIPSSLSALTCAQIGELVDESGSPTGSPVSVSWRELLQ